MADPIVYYGDFEGQIPGRARFVGGAGIQPQGGPYGFPDSGDYYNYAIIQNFGSIELDLIGLVVGQSYAISFLYAARPFGEGGLPFQVVLPGLVQSYNPIVTNWTRTTTATFVATATEHVVRFIDSNTPGGDRTTAFDSVYVVVPNGVTVPTLYYGNFEGPIPGPRARFYAGGAFDAPSAYQFSTPLPSGSRFALIQGAGAFELDYENLVVGASYRLTVYASGRPNYGGHPFYVKVDGTTIRSQDIDLQPWTPYTFDFVANQTSGVLKFETYVTRSGDRTTGFDKITLALISIPRRKIRMGGFL